MKQRIEDLERQVTTFKAQQTRAPTASDEADNGGSRGEDDGNKVASGEPVGTVGTQGSGRSGSGRSGSGRSVAAEAKERPTTITVNTNMAAPRGRKRTKRTDNNAHCETQGSSPGRPEPAQTRNDSSTSGQDVEAPSPKSDSARHASSQFLTQDSQEQNPPLQTPTTMAHQQTQDADADSAHAQHSQSLGTLLSEDVPQGPGQALLSSNTSSNTYIHPDLLSPTTHALNGAPHFAPPYFSPSIPNPAMYQGQFAGYPLVSMSAQGSYSGPNQEWSWPQQMSGHDNRRAPYGQQPPMLGELPMAGPHCTLRPTTSIDALAFVHSCLLTSPQQTDHYGPRSAPEPNPPPPAAGPADTYDSTKENAHHGLQHPHAPPIEVPPVCQSGATGSCRQPVDVEVHDIIGVELDLDSDLASTSGDKSPDPSAMTDTSSTCPSDIVDDMLYETSLLDAEQTRDLCRILQEVLDTIRSNEADEGASNSNPQEDSGGGRDQWAGRSSRAERTGTYRPRVRRQSLEDRFEFVRLCVAAVGFPSIDAVVDKYYTAEFRHIAPVARQQRVSRHTKLPLLLADLRNSTQTWTQWEAHGYQSEIMKSAAALIHDEREGLVVPRELFADARVELEKTFATNLAAPSMSGSSVAGRRLASGPSLPRGSLQLLTKTLQDSVRHCISLLSPTPSRLRSVDFGADSTYVILAEL